MSIPLIQKPEKDDINTSIIAIKRNIERINMLLGLVDSDSPDLSGFATKQELQDAVTDLQPVDEVTVGNMHSVTSNSVAEAVRGCSPKFLTAYASGTLTENGYLATSIPLNSKFIVSATCYDEAGYAAVPTRVNGNWWFFVFGITGYNYLSPRSGYVEVQYYYYDL